MGDIGRQRSRCARRCPRPAPAARHTPPFHVGALRAGAEPKMRPELAIEAGQPESSRMPAATSLLIAGLSLFCPQEGSESRASRPELTEAERFVTEAVEASRCRVR